MRMERRTRKTIRASKSMIDPMLVRMFLELYPKLANF